MPTLLGPYTVLSQERGEVICAQVATGVQRQFHISRLYPYTGSKEEAWKLACRDTDQYGVRSILGYRGEPVSNRRYMTFLVEYADGDKSWVQYGPDIYLNETFQDYISRIPELRILRLSAVEAGRYVMKTRQMKITPEVAPERFLIDLRVLDFTWYSSLELPHSDTKLYLLETHFKQFSNKHHTRAEVYLPALDESMKNLDYYWFESNATRLHIPEDAVFVDEEFLVMHPQVLGEQGIERQRILERTYSPVYAGTPSNRRGIFKVPAEVLAKAKKKSIVVEPRSSPRLQQDDHVPDVHDGHEVDVNRRSQFDRRESSSSPSKYLVPAVTSRKFPTSIGEVPTYSRREGLRKRTVGK